MGALSNKGGRGQRNREENGASRANFVASLLVRPARRNRHATQAKVTIVSRRMSLRLSELSIIERCHIIQVTIVLCRESLGSSALS